MTNSLAAELRQEGRKQGRLEGREEGREEGRLEGREAGRLEGREEGTVRTILTVLKARFRTVPPTIAKAVKSQSDPKTLEKLAATAGVCQSMADFKAQMRKLV